MKIKILFLLVVATVICIAIFLNTPNEKSQTDTKLPLDSNQKPAGLQNGDAKNIAKLLKDNNAGTRANAIKTLGQLQAKEYINDIAELLKDENGLVRARALWALWQLQGKECTGEAVKLLKDKNESVRLRAVDVLGQSQVKEHSKEVVGLLKDESGRVRAYTVKALEQLDAREYAKDISTMANNDKHRKARKYAQGLAKKWGVFVKKEKMGEESHK